MKAMGFEAENLVEDVAVERSWNTDVRVAEGGHNHRPSTAELTDRLVFEN